MTSERQSGVVVKAFYLPTDFGKPLPGHIEFGVRMEGFQSEEVLFLLGGVVATATRMARDLAMHAARSEEGSPAETTQRLKRAFHQSVAFWMEDTSDVSVNGHIRSMEYPRPPMPPMRKPPKDNGWCPDQDGAEGNGPDDQEGRSP